MKNIFKNCTSSTSQFLLQSIVDSRLAMHCNGVSLSQVNQEGTVIVIYSVCPLMNNQCYCNTVFTINTDTKVMEVRAQRRIKTGEEVSTQHVLPSMEQSTRLEYIKKVWDFICTCDRCQSP